MASAVNLSRHRHIRCHTTCEQPQRVPIREVNLPLTGTSKRPGAVFTPQATKTKDLLSPYVKRHMVSHHTGSLREVHFDPQGDQTRFRNTLDQYRAGDRSSQPSHAEYQGRFPRQFFTRTPPCEFREPSHPRRHTTFFAHRPAELIRAQWRRPRDTLHLSYCCTTNVDRTALHPSQ
jgi:hypothetical protein